MNKTVRTTLVGAAVAGLIGAAGMATSLTAVAQSGNMMGKCIGANSCKGQSNCAQVGKNDCAGKNACGGKGFLEMTKAECDAIKAKGKDVKFQEKKG